MSDSPKLSILIVTHASEAFIDSCLSSIQEHLVLIPHEVCVIDNASTDATRKIVQKKYSHYKLIKNHVNLGFAKAINQGLWETKAPYVLWLNPDAKLLDSNLFVLLQYFDQEKKVGILGPKVLNPDGSVQLSCRAFPSYEHYFFNRYSFLTKWFPKNPISQKYLKTDLDYTQISKVDWVSGACFLHRRELVHKVGLLDEGFFMYFEEVDFCRRAKRQGWKVMYHPGCQMQHEIAGSSQPKSVKTIIIRHKSIWRYYQKYFKSNHFKDLFIALGLVLRCTIQLILSKVSIKIHRGS